MASIEYDLYDVKDAIEKEFDKYGLTLDKNEIDGDFVRFSASITIKKFDNANVLFTGKIGNHGYGSFEAIFDEIEISDDSMFAVNKINDDWSLIKCCISRRGSGSNAKYYPVFSKTVRYQPSIANMCANASDLLDDIVDDDYEPDIRAILEHLV